MGYAPNRTARACLGLTSKIFLNSNPPFSFLELNFRLLFSLLIHLLRHLWCGFGFGFWVWGYYVVLKDLTYFLVQGVLKERDHPAILLHLR